MMHEKMTSAGAVDCVRRTTPRYVQWSERPAAFLSVDGITKHYPIPSLSGIRKVRSVDGVTLRVRPGEVMGLVGESGCGKSTFAKLVTRLTSATGGQITIDGEDWLAPRGETLRRRRRDVQLIFQDPYSALDPRMTIGTSMGAPMAHHGLGNAAERRDKVLRMLEEVGLDASFHDRLPRQCSGGQLQRIVIGRALLLEPKLLICDEPTSALDASMRTQILNLLRDLKLRRGITMVVISHDLRVVRYLCDRIAVMYLGKLVEIADRDQLFEAPAHPYTRALIAASLLDRNGLDATDGLLEGELPSPLNPPPGCTFHTRCPHARPDCSRFEPALREGRAGQFVRCRHWQAIEEDSAALPAGPTKERGPAAQSAESVASAPSPSRRPHLRGGAAGTAPNCPMGNIKMKRSLLLSMTSLAAAFAAHAQEGKRLTHADNTSIEANWDMYSDDSYIGSRAGCYEGLTRISQDIQVEPALATEWSQVDPTTWEFTIREGVAFQDGTPLDAAAAAGALNHLLSEPIPARAFSPEVIASVEASAPMTVRITTHEPLVSLPGRLGAPATAILSPAAYSGENVSPVGTCTGPFEITEVDPQQFVVVERNENYWGGMPKLAGGRFLFIPDANTRATMVRTGEAQIARLVPHTALSQLESSGDIELMEVEAPRITMLLMNNARPPLDDPKVRQAIMHAIDTAGISAAIYEGYAPPAGGPFRDGDPWAEPNAPAVTQDLEKARQLLEEAGVEPGSLDLELLAYSAKTELRPIGEIIQAMLGEIGIDVSVSVSDYGAIEGDLMSGNYDLALMSRGYLTDVPEPIGYLTADYHCEGSFNISQHCDPEIDAKLEAAAAEPDDVKRFAAYGEVAQHVYDQALTVFLINETLFDAVSTSVSGYAPHPLNYYVFDVDLDIQ